MTCKTRTPVVFALLPILIAGCIGTRHPGHNTVFYVLEYDAPAVDTAPPVAAVIQVERFQAAPVIQTDHMVYRQGPYTRYTDPYHKWRVNPGDLVTDNLIQDLRRSRMFGGVLAWGSRLSPTHLLQGTVDQFYEHDGPGGRQAVLGLSIVLALADPVDAAAIVVFENVYTIQEPLAEPTPEGFAQAMSRAMRTASGKMITDIRNALTAGMPRPSPAFTARDLPGDGKGAFACTPIP